MAAAGAIARASAALGEAAAAIRGADALLICTGAGMGVDSGLGTFRGKAAGVWAPLRALHMDFSEMSCPRWFDEDPRLAWAFWHYRHQAYTRGSPHAGYGLLEKWGRGMRNGFFSVTSNIDGHWVRTPGVGEERVYECHGTLMHMQYLRDDGTNPWPTDHAAIDALDVPEWDLAPGDAVEAQMASGGEWRDAVVDSSGGLAHPPSSSRRGAFPAARAVRRPGGEDLCRVREGGALPGDQRGAWRPAVLMFGDFGVNCARIDAQQERFSAWMAGLPKDARLAVVEIGAGTAVRTIRSVAERAALQFPSGSFIRINMEDASVFRLRGKQQVSVEGVGALAALTAIDELLGQPMG